MGLSIGQFQDSRKLGPFNTFSSKGQFKGLSFNISYQLDVQFSFSCDLAGSSNLEGVCLTSELNSQCSVNFVGGGISCSVKGNLHSLESGTVVVSFHHGQTISLSMEFHLGEDPVSI